MSIKRIFSAVLVLVLCAALLCACAEEEIPPEDIYYNVTFDYNGARENETKKVRAGSKLMQPTEPERADWIFIGWEYEAKNVVTEWDFESDVVSRDTVIKAKWISAATVFKYSVGTDGGIIITEYNSNLERIRVPSVISGMSVTAIGDNVFEGLDSQLVKLISLPSSVHSVGNSAFAGCKGIEIRLGGELKFVGESAFYECNALSEVTLGEGLSQIPFRAFGKCSGLSTVSIPSSVSVIGENAFENCVGIKTVLLRAKTAGIEDSAFFGCAPEALFFLGTADEWSSVSIAKSGNDALVSAELYFYSEKEPVNDGGYWYFDSSGKPRCWVK